MHYLCHSRLRSFLCSILLTVPIALIGSYVISVIWSLLNEDQAKVVWFLIIPSFIGICFFITTLIYKKLYHRYISLWLMIVSALLAFTLSVPIQNIIVMLLSPWWQILLGTGPETTAHWMIVSVCTWMFDTSVCGAFILVYAALHNQKAQP
jgi:uncharacterized membrane protein YeaQ/YmgE (transglycosylase-associated protein family)